MEGQYTPVANTHYMPTNVCAGPMRAHRMVLSGSTESAMYQLVLLSLDVNGTQILWAFYFCDVSMFWRFYVDVFTYMWWTLLLTICWQTKDWNRKTTPQTH